MSHSFGRVFKLRTFGESHGPAMGGVLEGCPAGVEISLNRLQKALDRRRPGSSNLVSQRKEEDRLEVLSGIYEGKTLGTPIGFIVRNLDARPEDYSGNEVKNRKGHASELWEKKFGHYDPRGSGRASGRETLSRVVGGAIAQQFLEQVLEPDVGQSPAGVKVVSFVQKVGDFELSSQDRLRFLAGLSSVENPQDMVDQHEARFPGSHHREVATFLADLKSKGESVGGVIESWIYNCPAGLGEPVFDKLKARLASAILSIGAFSSFELGEIDREALGVSFHQSQARYGGIQGGISNGEMIQFKAFVKPTSSILDVAKKGRHDPTILVRAVPVVEAMLFLIIADFVLLNRLSRI